MKIVFLDKETITSDSSVDFSSFNRRAEVVYYDKLSDPADIIAKTQDADVLVLNKVVLTADTIAKLSSSIRMIAITATGYDNVDIDAASARGIKVANVPGYGTQAVAQLTIMLLLACATQIIPQVDYMRQHGWSKKAGLAIPMHELFGKTLGVIGLGAIGTEVANLALCFGMNVVAYNRTPKNIPHVKMMDLPEVAKHADFVSLHCSLAPETRNLIDESFLRHMRKSAYLINTSRGGLVDEPVLIKALNEKWIRGAALDVLASEPPAEDNPLLAMKNVIVTPHIGWAPIETRQRCVDITESNITSFYYGMPSNLLN